MPTPLGTFDFTIIVASGLLGCIASILLFVASTRSRNTIVSPVALIFAAVTVLLFSLGFPTSTILHLHHLASLADVTYAIVAALVPFCIGFVSQIVHFTNRQNHFDDSEYRPLGARPSYYLFSESGEPYAMEESCIAQ